MSDGISQFAKLLQLRLDHRELLLGSCPYGAARGALTRPQGQQLFGLGQREAELSSMTDEAKTGDCVFAVAAITGVRAARLWQDADALVVADCLDADAGKRRDGADREGLAAHDRSMGAVPNYRVKGSRTSWGVDRGR